jgi:hypothetical protein
MSGLAVAAEGEVVRAPVPGVYLHCEQCGGLLRFLIRCGGRALCKSCIAALAINGRAP